MYLRTLKTFTACVLASAIPMIAVAAGSVSIETPAIAGLGTRIQLKGFSPSQAMHISVDPPEGDEILLPVTTDENGDGRQELKGDEMRIAGTYSVRIEAKGQTLFGPEHFDVLPDSLSLTQSTIRALSPSIASDGRDTAEIVVTLRDTYGNALSGRPVTLLSGKTGDTIIPLAQQTDARGELHFLVSTTNAGTINLRALDLLSGNALAAAATVTAGQPSPVGGSQTWTTLQASAVTAYQPRMYYAQTSGQTSDVIDHFEITAPDSLPAGQEAPSITITAVDGKNQTVEAYVGTIVFSSSDPTAVLPNFGRYTFKDRDLGEKEFPLVLKFNQGGLQKLRVEDLNDTSIAGEVTIAVDGNSAAPSQIAVTKPLNGDSVNTTNIVVEGKGPTFANLIVMGGLADVTGATDKDGNFSIPVALNSAKREFTIRVRDANGASDSGPIELTLDTTPPQIGSITFSPEKPGMGEKVLVVVQSDPQLKSVTLQLLPAPTSGDVTLTLTENTTASGSYQGFLTAPEDGAYQPVVTAVDRAGNETEVRTTFTVGLQGLPTVQNLRGSAKSNAASLEWDGVSEKVDGYRIYVGEKPDNFLYTLDTGRITSKATVAGLVAGRTYYFAATAVQGKRESAQKSTVLKVDVPGIVLKVVPGDGKLLLEWQTPKVSLQSYRLEYGVKAGNYTEKRIVAAKKTDDGAPQAYTLGDLINGVTYFIRLTPITVTGDALTDLITEGSGSPQANGTAFTPGAGDPIPFNPDTIALSHTPKNVQSGLPGIVWFGIATLALGICAWQWQRRKSMRQTAAFMAAIQKHYGY